MDGGDLEAWAAGARAEDAARSRIRERWLRQQDAEGANFTAVLAGLAERRAPVTLTTTAGRTHQGRLVSVGADVVALDSTSGHSVVVRLDAVLAVVPRDERSVRLGAEDAPEGEVTLADVLARAAPERPRIRVQGRGRAEALVGELRAAGADLCVVLLDGDPPAPAYLALSSVSEVVFLSASG